MVLSLFILLAVGKICYAACDDTLPGCYDVNGNPYGTPDCINGVTAVISGDPHWTTFNNVRNHFQGNVDALDPNQQFYLMTTCEFDGGMNQPFSMIGKLYRWWSTHLLSGLEYVVLELYTQTEILITDYVFVSTQTSYLKYATAAQNEGKFISPVITDNADITFNTLPNGVTTIGDFSVTLSGRGTSKIIVKLTYKDGCEVSFTMQTQKVYDGHTLHKMWVTPPPCYRITTCGLLGDFQTPLGCPELLMCTGQRFQYSSAWDPKPAEIWDAFGWTWNINYPPCGRVMYGPSDGSDGDIQWGAADAIESNVDNGNVDNTITVNDDNGEVFLKPDAAQFECDDDLKSKIIVACQKARDELMTCCRNIGGSYCNNLQDDCEIDLCAGMDPKTENMDELIKNSFTEIIKRDCDARGVMGPVPKLLYEFQQSFDEQMTGDSKYELQASGNAEIDDGVLKCDGGFVYSKSNLDFKVESYSVEVLVTIHGVDQIGGGVIGIDSNYDDNGGYTINEYDSIIYNQNNDNKWSLNDGGASGVTAEIRSNEYIHLVAVYDNEEAKLYRNGKLDSSMSYDTAADGQEGTRIMFCKSYFEDVDTVFGSVRYGAYYDYSLLEEDIYSLYSTSIVNVYVYGIDTQFEVINGYDELKSDDILTGGQALRSLNGEYVATMQLDGKFVVHNIHANNNLLDDEIIWQINTDIDGVLSYRNNAKNIVLSNDISRLILSNEGYLCAYKTDDNEYWNNKDYNQDIDNQETTSFFVNYLRYNNSNNYYLSYIAILSCIFIITISFISIYRVCRKEKQKNEENGKYKAVSSDVEKINFKNDLI